MNANINTLEILGGRNSHKKNLQGMALALVANNIMCIYFICLFAWLSSFQLWKGKWRENTILMPILYLQYMLTTLCAWFRPLRWQRQILVTCVQRHTAQPLCTMWQPTAVERTFMNVINAIKHLIKPEVWRTTSSLILEKRHRGVCNAANHFRVLVNLEPIYDNSHWREIAQLCTV